MESRRAAGLRLRPQPLCGGWPGGEGGRRRRRRRRRLLTTPTGGFVEGGGVSGSFRVSPAPRFGRLQGRGGTGRVGRDGVSRPWLATRGGGLGGRGCCWSPRREGARWRGERSRTAPLLVSSAAPRAPGRDGRPPGCPSDTPRPRQRGGRRRTGLGCSPLAAVLLFVAADWLARAFVVGSVRCAFWWRGQRLLWGQRLTCEGRLTLHYI